MDKKQALPFQNAEFTKEMKSTYTILAPDIFPMHMGLLQGIFRMYGYNLEVLRSRGKNIIDTGLKYIHNDMCYPAICMSGQQLDALTSGEYDPHKVALIQFQTGGGCRASNYIWMLRKALHNMGMDYVPVISLSFNRMERASGFKVTPAMIAKGIMSLVYGDLLMLLRNQVRPYEKNPGDTQRVVDKWNDELLRQFSHNRGLFGRRLRRNLADIVRDFAAIPTEKRQKTKVGIVGEIYVKYSAFGNNGLEDFLDSQDCEFMVPGVLGFFQCMFDNRVSDYQLYGGRFSQKAASVLGGKAADRMEKALLDALKPYPQFHAPAPFAHIRALGDEIIGRGVKMGEGWLLPAEMAELIEGGYPNIVCAQPFGCLPNHIVGKGVIRTVREMYPDANICPIDYDAGASRVNQENRIKLMLAVAKEKATEETEIKEETEKTYEACRT